MQNSESTVKTLSEENLIAILEAADSQGDSVFVQKNLPALQKAIDRIQRRVFTLSQLQYRACVLRDAYQSDSIEDPSQ